MTDISKKTQKKILEEVVSPELKKTYNVLNEKIDNNQKKIVSFFDGISKKDLVVMKNTAKIIYFIGWLVVLEVGAAIISLILGLIATGFTFMAECASVATCSCDFSVLWFWSGILMMPIGLLAIILAITLTMDGYEDTIEDYDDDEEDDDYD